MLKPLVIALVAAAPAHGGVVQFATRSSFNAAAGPLETQSLSRCDTGTVAFAGPLDATHANNACPAGVILPGLSIADLGPGGGSLYLAAPGYSGNRARAVGQNTRASDPLVLDFLDGANAVAFDLFQNFGGGAQLGRPAPFEVQLWSGTNLLADVTVTVRSRHGAFFGALSDGDVFTRILVNNPLAYDLVSNIAFSRAPDRTVAPVPEPDPIALVCLATATLVLRRR